MKIVKDEGTLGSRANSVMSSLSANLG